MVEYLKPLPKIYELGTWDDICFEPMSPIIEAVGKKLAAQFDGEVMRAVQEVGIVVNKDRLVQALTDANRFYEEGYIAGKNFVHKHGEWEDCRCSVCGKISPTLHLDMENEYKIRETPYCPNCGAKMDGKEGAE